MALQDYVKDDQYDNKDHRNEGKSIRDPYLRHGNNDHEQVNNRDKVNDLMSVRTEDKSRKRLFHHLLRILAVVLFLGIFICLTVFFFLYDFDKGSSDEVIFVGKSNIATVPSNTVDSTSILSENGDILPESKQNITLVPEKKVAVTPEKKVTSAPVQTSSNNTKKEVKPTNQQTYYYDNHSQYDYLAQYDNHSQYEGLSQYDNSFQYENLSRYDNRFQYENLSRYDNSFQYENLFQSKYKYQYDNYRYEDYYANNWNGQRFNEINSNYFSYSEPQVSFPESFKQREETTFSSSKKSYPVIGERAYNDYLEKNLRKLPDSACDGEYGKIILMFKVNERGRPYDIAILRSLCPTVDEEAIRLLQTGSNWTPCDNYARIEIYF